MVTNTDADWLGKAALGGLAILVLSFFGLIIEDSRDTRQQFRIIEQQIGQLETRIVILEQRRCAPEDTNGTEGLDRR